MKARVRVLFVGEVRRALTPMTLVLVVGMSLLCAFMNILPLQLANQTSTPALSIVVRTSESGVQLILALLLAGVVAHDVRTRWLRTLLTRPVTREQYLRAKMGAMYAIGMAGILLANLIALLYVGAVAGISLQWDWGSLAQVASLFLLQGALVTAMMAFLSCWLPGYMNLVVIAAWALVSQFLQLAANGLWWDQPVAATLIPFFFPSGFNEAIELVSAGATTPTVELFWGLAALSGFLALAHYSIGRMQVEKGSDE